MWTTGMDVDVKKTMQVEDNEMWKRRQLDFIQRMIWNLTTGTRNTNNVEQLLLKLNFQENFYFENEIPLKW